VIELVEPLDRERLAALLYQAWSRSGGLLVEWWAPPECYVLDHRGYEWVVYYSERGLETGLRSFQSEDLACRHLADLLWKDRTVHPDSA
jgi:hypothetical protein